MWRSAVQLCQELLNWGISSVGLEHLPCTQGVKGSSPLFSTEFLSRLLRSTIFKKRSLTWCSLNRLRKRNNKYERKQKGSRWMPWLYEAMKDVISCDKLRVGANNLWSADFRMGKPFTLMWNPILGGKRGELKHLITHRRRKQKWFR